jgi:plastocyanin
MAESAPKGFGLTFAVGVVALFLAVGAIGFAYVGSNTQISSLQSQVSSLQSGQSTLAGLASVNRPPEVLPVKLAWCSLDEVSQDRFCPNIIIADQGDIVQLFFISNDTAAHTFTMTGTYDFQINDSGAGELDFLTNYSPIAGNCSNSGTFAQISAGVSGVYCVSGTSLLDNATLTTDSAFIFGEAQNPSPGLPFTNSCVSGEPAGVCYVNPGPIEYPVNDQAHMLSLSKSGVGVNATGLSETQGIGAFRATTPGIYIFFCRYHVANGMFGYLVVLPNAYCNSNATACGITKS